MLSMKAKWFLRGMMQSDEIVTISGKRGYGKTTIAKDIIKSLSRVAIWDPMGEFQEFKGAYLPKEGTITEFNEWLKPLWETGNIFIMVDEADQVMPEGKPICFYANQSINLGRHRNIGFGSVTRRLARLNKDAVAQSHKLILFHHFLINDIKYLSDMIPDAHKLKTLKKYQYFEYDL